MKIKLLILLMLTAIIYSLPCFGATESEPNEIEVVVPDWFGEITEFEVTMSALGPKDMLYIQSFANKHNYSEDACHKALRLYHEIINRSNFERPDAHIAIADMFHYRLKDNENAIKVYQEIIKKYPEQRYLTSTCYLNIGNSYKDEKEYTKAKKWYNSLIEKFGKDESQGVKTNVLGARKQLDHISYITKQKNI